MSRTLLLSLSVSSLLILTSGCFFPTDTPQEIPTMSTTCPSGTQLQSDGKCR